MQVNPESTEGSPLHRSLQTKLSAKQTYRRAGTVHDGKYEWGRASESVRWIDSVRISLCPAFWVQYTGKTYWESIQNYLEKTESINSSSKHVRVVIPTNNILDDEGIKRIVGHTKLRFARFENERIGAQELIRVFEKEFNVETYYNPDEGSIIIGQPGSNTGKIFFFKNFSLKNIPKMKKLLMTPEISRVVKKRRLSEPKALALLLKVLYEDYLKGMWHTLQEYEQKGSIEIRDKEGNIIEVFHSLEDYGNYRERQNLLEEYEELFEDTD